MPVLTEKETRALRVAIATLPIDPQIKRTWLQIIQMVEAMPKQQETALLHLAQATAALGQAVRARKVATVLLAAAIATFAAALGAVLGELI